MIISKEKGGGSEKFAPIDAKYYWLSNDTSFVKIRILRFAADRYKVSKVMLVKAYGLASMRKPQAGEV